MRLHQPLSYVLALSLCTAAVAAKPASVQVVVPSTLKAITTGKPPASHEKPTLLEGVKMLPRVMATYAQGTTAAIGAIFSPKFGGFSKALKTANKLSDQRLQKMPDNVRAELAGVLLHGSMFGGSTAKADAGAQFMRVLTVKGRDAGAVMGTLSRLGIFDEATAAKKLDPASREKFSQLMTEIKPKVGDWNSFQSFAEAATGAKARSGNKVELLVNGSTYFPDMEGALDSAQKFVVGEKFAIHSDETGHAVMDKFADAAKRGVNSLMVYDAVGSMASDPKIFKDAQASGVELVSKAAKRPLGGSIDHQKIIAVDGKVAYVGGMNLGTEYEKIWHDIQSKIAGPIVGDFTDMVIRQAKQGGAKISRGLRKSIRRAKAEAETQPSGEMVALAVDHVGLKDQNQKVLYLHAAQTAQKRIWLENPYMTDAHMVTALSDAAKRGVDVRIILPARNDEKLLAWGERAFFEELLSSGAKVYQYVGKDLNNPQMAHGKVALFDDQLSTIGSSNLDQRSLKNNDEANVWVRGSELNQELASQVFEKDFVVSKEVASYSPTGANKIEDKLLRMGANQL